MMTVGVSDFVRRQVAGSGKTYSPTLTFTAMAEHAARQLARGACRPGYRDGVILVAVDPALVPQFICPYVRIREETKLRVTRTRRRPDEEPYLQIQALNGKPLRAGNVELVLYRHDVLAETGEESCDTEWELISIQAIPEGLDTMPMGPVTMMRNQLQLSGGTKAHYSSEEWAEAVHFWQHYAPLAPEQ
ncbi:MAG: DUF3228 family protein [Fidelibacterota bacterium]